MASNDSQHQTPDPSSPRREGRGCELAGIAIVVVVLLLVGGALIAVFRGQHRQHQRPESIAAPGSSLDLDAFGDNSGAKLAYERGLGTRPNLTRQLDGVTVSVNWAYADVNALLAYVTIQGRSADIGHFAGTTAEGAQYASCPIILGLDRGAGTLIQPFDSSGYYDTASDVAMNEGYTVSRDMLTVHCLAAADISYTHPSDQIRAHILVTTAGIATPSAGRQLEFAVNVPVVPGRIAEPHQTATVAGKQIVLDRVVVTPVRTTIYLGGAGRNWMANVPFITINGWKYQYFGHGNTFIKSIGQESDFFLPYPDPSRAGAWTIQIRPGGVITGTPPPEKSEGTAIRVNLPSVPWMRQLGLPATPPATPSATPEPATPTPLPSTGITIPKIFRGNSDVASLMTAGYGKFPNQSIHSGGLTITLAWIYADAEQVYVYYTATGLPSLSTAQTSAGDLCPGRISFKPKPEGTSLGASGAGVDGDVLECYAEVAAESSSLGSTMTVKLSTSSGDDSVTAQVPVLPARIAEPHKTAVVNGKSVTFDRLMVTPSGLLIDYSSPGAETGDWRVSINGWTPEVDTWGAMITRDPSHYACACYYLGASRLGPWTIKFTHYPMTVNQPGNPSATPGITATFTVDLPPASWNQPQVVVPSPTAAPLPSATPMATPAPSSTDTATPVAHSQAPPSNQQIKDSQAFSDHPAAKRAIEAGLGSFVNKPEKLGPTIVEVRWVYADSNEIAVFFTIRNRATDWSRWADKLFPPEVGEGLVCPGLLNLPTPIGAIFDQSPGAGAGGDSKLESCLRIAHVSLTTQQGPIAVDLSGNLCLCDPPDPSQAFHFALTIPMTSGLVATPYQHSSIDGKTVTLDRFAVTPNPSFHYLEWTWERVRRDGEGAEHHRQRLECLAAFLGSAWTARPHDDLLAQHVSWFLPEGWHMADQDHTLYGVFNSVRKPLRHRPCQDRDLHRQAVAAELASVNCGDARAVTW